MALPPPYLHDCHLGSFVCERWDLRVTQRTVEEDLESSLLVGFATWLRQPLVDAFTEKRRDHFLGGDEVSPLPRGHQVTRDEDRVWVLRGPGRRRGGTLYDDGSEVIWLLADTFHTSGAADDSFPVMKQLAEDGRLFPTSADYTALTDDRDRRAEDAIPEQVGIVLGRARAQPGEVISETLAVGVGVAARVEVIVDPDMEDLSIIIDASHLPSAEMLQEILTAFDPDLDHEDWQMGPKAQSPRELRPGEIFYHRTRA